MMGLERAPAKSREGEQVRVRERVRGGVEQSGDRAREQERIKEARRIEQRRIRCGVAGSSSKHAGQ